MKYAAVSYTRAPLAQGYTDRVLKIDLSSTEHYHRTNIAGR